jgi:dephospho-CoA kinase
MRKRNKTVTPQRQLSKLRHLLKSKMASHATALDRKNFWKNDELVRQFVAERQEQYSGSVEKLGESIADLEGAIAELEAKLGLDKEKKAA